MSEKVSRDGTAGPDAEVRAAALGSLLREKREERGLSLREVEGAVKIHVRHLEALEKGNPGVLPHPMYVRGFVVIYANHLGLDGEGIYAEYLDPEGRAPRSRGGSGRPWRKRPALIGALLLGAAGLAGAVTVAAVVAPYNPAVSKVQDVLSALAPDTFFDGGPQHVLVLGAAGSGEDAVADSVVVARVSDEGLGMLSVPSHMRVEVPGYGPEEVGRSLMLGGPELARRSTARLTGVEVTDHVVVRTEGLAEIVDRMGGVRFDVEEPMRGRSSGTATREEVELRPGPQTLDGEGALLYLRWGSEGRSETEQAARHQRLLTAVLEQSLAPAVLLNPRFRETVSENVETNMSAFELAQTAIRVQWLRASGAPEAPAVVPGREEAAPPTEAAPMPHYVPDPERLPAALDRTLR